MSRSAVKNQVPGQDEIWCVLRILNNYDAYASLGMISELANAKRYTTASYLKRLVVAGHVKHNTRGYKIVSIDPPVTTPRVDDLGKSVTTGKVNKFLWQTMRLLKRFTIQELMDAATTTDCQMKRSTTATYCKHLRRSGYLRIGSHERQSSPMIYVIVPTRFKGPLAPMITKEKQVWDPNKQLIMEALYD